MSDSSQRQVSFEKQKARRQLWWEIFILGPMVVSVAGFGFCVREYYDWTEADQSRPTIYLWLPSLVTLVYALIVTAAVPFLPKLHTTNGTRKFGLKGLLAAVLVTAFLASIGIQFSSFAAVSCLVIATGVTGIELLMVPDSRCRVLAFVCVMLLPGTWLAMEGVEAIVFGMPRLPGFLIGGVVNRLMGGATGPDQLSVTATVATAVVILMGLASIRFLPRFSLVYIAFTLCLTVTNSLFLHALMRA